MRRWTKKFLLWWTLRGLPADLKAVAMKDLLEALDVSNRSERAYMIKEAFHGWKESLTNDTNEKIAEIEKTYEEKLAAASKLMLAPNFPMPHFSVNQGLLDEATKAKINREIAEEEIMNIPLIRTWLLILTLLVLILSIIANYFTLTIKLGNDYIDGNDTITAVVNAVFSVLLAAIELIGFYVLINFTPGGRLKINLARVIGIFGAILLIVGVSIIIFSRTEIGGTALTATQSVGKIE